MALQIAYACTFVHEFTQGIDLLTFQLMSIKINKIQCPIVLITLYLIQKQHKK